MEGGLVYVDNLVVIIVVDGTPQLLHELKLLLLERILFSKALPISVVRPDELHFKFDVVPPQGHGIKCLQLKPVSHDHGPLLQAQVHHALEGINVGHPLNLLGG
jgi:hypothetical protein